jgi:serine protease Do
MADPKLPDDPSNPRVTPVVRAYRKARPAVVNISSQSIVTTGVFGDDLFDQIFPSPLTRRVPVQSLGSGFVLHPSGYVVTNAHVVRRAQKVTVTLDGDVELPARIISADPAHDLAVLKVEPPAGKPLAYLPLGRSDDLMVGETVIAIGNPMGYANSVTTGVVSAVSRTLEFSRDVKYDGLIQTDAPINPGNSGGPLLNVNGELIGVNTAIRADAQNIGFAIPADAIADELLRLLDFERLNRVVFGASVTWKRGLDGTEVIVDQVRPGTPADGKLAKGDRLLAVGDVAVSHMPDFACAMLAATPADVLRFRLDRDGKSRMVELSLKAKPRPDGVALAEALWGVTLRPITPETARDFRLPTERGLVVTAVEKGGPADKLGVKVRDVLFQVGQLYVTDTDDLGMLLEDVKGGQVIRIGVLRGNTAAVAPLTAREPKGTAASRPSSQPAAGEGMI